MKLTLLIYRLYASLYSVANYLRGEYSPQASYQAGNNKRIHRSLCNIEKSIFYGWQDIKNGGKTGSLLVYAATIGEFHPLIPVINTYLKQKPGTPLVIFSGQLQYVQAMSALYPQAAVGILPPSAPWLYDKLFELVRPCAVVLGEGPCLYLHFPIPFDLALPAACLRHTIPMIVANATLHEHHVFSPVNWLENWLFGKMYTQAIRYWYTPNDIFKSWLLKAGVPSERIIVSGDLRFDDRRHLCPASTELTDILDHLRQQGPVIVAGSVNAIDEEGPVIDGWLAVREKHKNARLVIAPRHINNNENMGKVYDYLIAKEVRFAKRSEDIENVKNAEVIVVDVFGELPYYYSAATIAYIGRNHGVLEPLRFLVPTVVAPQADWASNYVTFPVYKHMIDQGGIIESPDKKDLGLIFSRIIDDPGYGKQFVDNATRVAENERGAGEKIVQHMKGYVI